MADSIPALRLAYDNFLGHFGAVGSTGEFDRLNGPSLREIITELKAAHGLEADRPELTKIYIDKINEVYPEMARPYRNVVELLEYAGRKGWLIALVTSANGDIAREFIARNELDRYFNAVVTASDVERTKPNPEIYYKALENLGINAEEAVAVEDSISGVTAATSAGIETIALDRNGTLSPIENSKVLCRLDNLKMVLQFLKDNSS